MPRPWTARRPRGASLIEALIAMMVFLIGIIGVMQMDTLASRQNTVARGESAASKMARDLAYAFERLPYHHPLFRPPDPALSHLSADFTDFDNPNGRFLLSDAATLTSGASARPLVSAAEAMRALEEATASNGYTYQVAWRSAPLVGEDGITVDARVIVIMVRFRTFADNFRQVNVWTVKYDPFAVIDAGAIIQEI